ncbi:MAG: O-antigen ligase family protein [Planctomycetota bacterium]
MRGATIALALGIAAITLLFETRWIDAEATRRALAGVVVGIGLLLTWRPGRVQGIRGGLPLLLLCGWAALRCIDAVNVGEAILRAAWWITLAITVFAGAQFDRRSIAQAALPTGLLLAGVTVAQSLGLVGWCGGSPLDPVGTLGNRNASGEVLAIAFAFSAWLHGVGAPRWNAVALFALALVFTANGTRAAMLGALLVAIAIRLVLGRRDRYGLLLAASVCIVATLVPRWNRTSPATEAPTRTEISADPVAFTPSTIAVRLALWRGVGAMVADAPMFGHGTGQLRFVYPRYRRQEEIEASSFGRQFPTVVESAHDDPLEIAAELGLVGVALIVWFLGRALRGADLASCAVLLAFAVPSLFRSPLGNAPAALLAALWLGALAARRQPIEPRARRHPALVVLGCALIWLCWQPLYAAQNAAWWLDGAVDSSLDSAIALHPSEPRYRSLRIEARCGGLESDGTLRKRTAAEYAACRDDLAALAVLDPDNTNALFLTAQLAQGAGLRDVAREALTRILRLDPREPRAQMLAAVLLFQEGKHAEAIDRLYADPHPRLRQRLADTLTALGTAPEVKDDTAARALYAREAAFVRAIDACAKDPTGAATRDAIHAFTALTRTDDARAQVLRAHEAMADGRRGEAEALATSYAALSSSARRLLAPVTQGLTALPAWRDALAGTGN